VDVLKQHRFDILQEEQAFPEVAHLKAASTPASLWKAKLTTSGPGKSGAPSDTFSA